MEEDDDKDENVAEDKVDYHDILEDGMQNDDVEDEDANGEEAYVVEEKHDDFEEENRSQDREAHLARARASDMGMDISQEPFCREIDQIPPRLNTGP